ncbi:hypothetical protein JQN58_05240 [Aneurinibacillus sp. BA2021]|nr:hypothetical protein [Aneurinibacillus sp. BA2021]
MKKLLATSLSAAILLLPAISFAKNIDNVDQAQSNQNIESSIDSRKGNTYIEKKSIMQKMN